MAEARNVKRMKRVLIAALIAAVAVAMGPLAGLTGTDAYAASKPAAPKKVKAAVTAQDTVTITWNKVKSAKGYTVYQKKGSKFKAVKTTKAKKAVIKKLKADTTYTFYVKAYKNKGKKKVYGKASAKVTATPKAATSPAPAAICSNGQFVGTKEASGVLSYKGVPYAKAPTGELRWQAPQAPDKSDAVYQATDFGHPSVQAIYPLPDPAQGPEAVSWVFDGSKYTVSEDCLTLNVWTKDIDPAEKKPVMVWFHGGGFVVGSTANDAYQLENFANREDMVMVSVNYRLGLFGSADLSAVPEGTTYKHSDFKDAQNLALLDDIQALEWIQENITAFGGDPNNVTIFGNSAGAADITILTATTNQRVQNGDLFKRVIAQSGGLALCVPDDTKDGVPGPYKQERTGEVEKLMKLTGAKNLDDLMALSEADIICAYTGYYDPANMDKGAVPMGTDPAAVATMCYDNVFTPVYNDAAGLLPKDPYDLVAEGAGKNIDVMYGSNQNEWNYWIWEMAAFDPAVDYPKPLLDEDYNYYTFGMIPLEKMAGLTAAVTEDEMANNVQKFLALPRVSSLTNEYAKDRTDAEWKTLVSEIYGMPAEAVTEDMIASFKENETDVWKNTEIHNDLVFRGPAIKAAADHAAAGGTGKTYMYYWAKETGEKYQKAGHASEISYVTGNTNHTCFSGKVDVTLSNQIQDMWANFARTGDPSANGITWTEYDKTNRATMTMDLDDDMALKMVNAPYDDQRELIEPLLKYHLK